MCVYVFVCLCVCVYVCLCMCVYVLPKYSVTPLSNSISTTFLLSTPKEVFILNNGCNLKVAIFVHRFDQS